MVDFSSDYYSKSLGWLKIAGVMSSPVKEHTCLLVDPKRTGGLVAKLDVVGRPTKS